MKNKSVIQGIKYNKYIFAPLGIVKVLDKDGNFLQEMPLNKALKLAFTEELDLVQIGADKIPVCKICDFSKYKYELAKKNKEKNNNNKSSEMKVLKITLNISENDLINQKLKQCSNFLEKNHDVTIVLRLKGRENIKPEIGITFLQNMKKYFKENWYVKKEPIQNGKEILMVVSKKSSI
jgi:translation initiation factor IF-3